jgi:nitroimidazol reductase NimA-like FMN-containing flavoprotein (pyridoxamine 5'-phosphate oxidase superfamily)
MTNGSDDTVVGGEAGGVTGAAAPSERTAVRRLADRARYDRDSVVAILDEGFICHLGFAGRDGRPVVIPTTYGRSGDTVYVHGSPAAGMVRSLEGGLDVSLAVTLVDGLVLARSAFHHSVNYRSVVLFGNARKVTDPDEKVAALDAIVDHIVPGRRPSLRASTRKEVAGTAVLALALDEASAKVRTGPPVDDDDDVASATVWAGVLPLELVPGVPEPDAFTTLPVPDHVAGYRRHGRA